MIKIRMNSQNKFLSALIGGSFLILLLGQILLSDLGSRLKKNSQEVRLEERKLAEIIGIRENRARIMADYAQYEPYLALEKTSSRQVIEELLREIERIARDAGASVINLTPQNISEAGQGLTEYKADLRLECSADQILIFFNNIQQSRFLIKVVRFSISSRDEKGLALQVEMLLSLRVG